MICSAVGLCSGVPSLEVAVGVVEVESVLFHSREYPVLISFPNRPGVFVSTVAVTAGPAAPNTAEGEGVVEGDLGVWVGVAPPEREPVPTVATESAGMTGQEETGRMRERVPSESSRPLRMAASPRDMVYVLFVVLVAGRRLPTMLLYDCGVDVPAGGGWLGLNGETPGDGNAK
jgi:hypothetical protein